MGISEACFAIEDGKKLDGSLGYEDGYVVRWAGRSNIHNELEAFGKHSKMQFRQWIKMKATVKSTEALIQSKLAEAANDSMKVDMTGTGIDKTKRSEYDRKKNHT